MNSLPVLNPQIMKSVEQLDYVVTVGDVASQAGLELNIVQQGLLTLASEAGGHLQVAESGDIVFQFPRNFRSALQNKYWRLRLQALAQKIWGFLFYLIRISFGIILILSIILMFVAIAAILIALNSKDGDNDSRGNNGPSFFFFPTDIFWIFDPGVSQGQAGQRAKGKTEDQDLNFLEAVFSFLFGDGNPNQDLEERRWRDIGTLIRNAGGVITAEQAAPYLDNVTIYNQENEDYILPVLARFNGFPQVTEQGGLVYTFPELQVSAKQRKLSSLGAYLKEKPWRFSKASSGQILGAVALGSVNIVLALVLGGLFRSYGAEVAEIGFVGFVQSIYYILLAYGVGFLAIPLGRYFSLQWLNQRLEGRNLERQGRVEPLLQPGPDLRHKLDYAKALVQTKVIDGDDIAYSTEQDLLEQEVERSAQIDHDWQKRLESGT
ncbi:hypothetical protein [Synechocystis sp. LKSZ1]|uniref:hypothetical protein n=1 Tax=Synechocystis sp. LKSZ1 TaxID=3144951 RepID=UPI00336C07CC